MTEKEFRKLRSLDLIQILLTQGNEETRLQEELGQQKEYLEKLREHNDDLKTALNDKDALIETLKQDLNQSDEDIRNLRAELKELYADKLINLENIGSLTEVAKRVNHIFETAQREAEEYLAHPERVRAVSDNSGPSEVVAAHGLPVTNSTDMDGIMQKAGNITTETAGSQTEISVPGTIGHTDEDAITDAADVSGMNTETNARTEIIPDADIVTGGTSAEDSPTEGLVIENVTAEDSVTEDAAIGDEATEDSVTEDVAIEDTFAETTANLAETTNNQMENMAAQTEIAGSQPETTDSQPKKATGLADTVAAEESMAAGQAAVEKHGAPHHKVTAKKVQSNKNWLKKLIGRIK